MLLETLAIGGGRGEMSDAAAIVGGLIALGCSAALLFQWRLPADIRARWGRGGSGPPMSRVGVAAWSFCAFVWALGMLTKPFKVIPHLVMFYCIGAATILVFAAGTYDGLKAARRGRKRN